ncbi:sensor histidine kinase [Arenimonas composti]|uniref:histidine kinase n=1 Tax=Arenimonas composti TR7-09 = DSM 18010 TaxID=1121013 RepID=A0A091BA63_9GAMM|nr:histidine kinase [Arenimonas composti]KFN48621.1 hypothetical protein P873_14070 [Arenimonas composti TR7-09 = DSM 18010]
MDVPVRDYSLQEALPAEVLLGGDHVLGRYRRFPVFSLPWLLGRSWRFAAAITAFALIVGFGAGAVVHDVHIGLMAGVHMFIAFAAMCMVGPALATWVRHRRWRARTERIGVVVAILLGIAVAFAADRWASGYVETHVEARMVDQGMVPERRKAVAPELKTVALAINGLVLLSIYGVLGGAFALRAYFSESRRWQEASRQRELLALRRRAEQADQRLGLLQAQVEPHFLFNTLASVRALVRQDPAMAEATLDALVDHLRATIPKLRDGQAALHSTLGQQLDICASYLQLMKLRTGGRLSYAVEAEPALRALPFPPLLLITLVENAIKHGIEPQPGPGRVEVRGSVKSGRLVVSVVDDGAGLQPGIGSGVGLANVREQLAARFGDAASLSLRGLAGRGAVAEIAIPYPQLPPVGAPSGAMPIAPEGAPTEGVTSPAAEASR